MTTILARPRPIRSARWGTVSANSKSATPCSYGGGVYAEHVSITGKTRIVIQSFPGEQAIIDGARAEFRGVPNDLWRPGEADGEYVTRVRYPTGTEFGAFLGPAPYTRPVSMPYVYS